MALVEDLLVDILLVVVAVADLKGLVLLAMVLELRILMDLLTWVEVEVATSMEVIQMVVMGDLDL